MVVEQVVGELYFGAERSTGSLNEAVGPMISPVPREASALGNRFTVEFSPPARS